METLFDVAFWFFHAGSVSVGIPALALFSAAFVAREVSRA